MNTWLWKRSVGGGRRGVCVGDGGVAGSFGAGDDGPFVSAIRNISNSRKQTILSTWAKELLQYE